MPCPLVIHREGTRPGRKHETQPVFPVMEAQVTRRSSPFWSASPANIGPYSAATCRHRRHPQFQIAGYLTMGTPAVPAGVKLRRGLRNMGRSSRGRPGVTIADELRAAPLSLGRRCAGRITPTAPASAHSKKQKGARKSTTTKGGPGLLFLRTGLIIQID